MAANPQPASEKQNHKITCHECKEEFAVITSAHLAKHGLSRNGYQEKYPGAPLHSEHYIQNKRAIVADADKGKGIRAGLEKGRTPEVRAKAMETMIKNGKVADSAFMGTISRLGWAPELRDSHAANIRLAQLRPERQKLQSQVANKIWDKRRADAQELAQARTNLAKAARVLASRGGRDPEDERAALTDSLYKQQIKWGAIKEQVEARFHVHTTVKALQGLRTRWLERQKRTT